MTNQALPGGAWPRVFWPARPFACESPIPCSLRSFLRALCFRRERHSVALILGGLAGVACRPLLAALVFGDPFFVKDHVYGFSGLYADENLIMYLTALLVLVPGRADFRVVLPRQAVGGTGRYRGGLCRHFHRLELQWSGQRRIETVDAVAAILDPSDSHRGLRHG